MVKPLILFDLNGTLVHRTNSWIAFRPNIDSLRCLVEFCDLGIYTSMTEKNAKRVLDMIRLHYTAIFDDDCIMMHRGHTTNVSKPFPWSSVKPIKKWFPTRVVFLVDDEVDSKALPGELDNFIQISSWQGDGDDTALRNITEVLVKKLESLKNDRRQQLPRTPIL